MLKPLMSGCSMGAFHAANFLFHYPELVAGVIALSGVYSTRDFFGASLEGGIYFHSPLDYLAELENQGILQEGFVEQFEGGLLLFEFRLSVARVRRSPGRSRRSRRAHNTLRCAC